MRGDGGGLARLLAALLRDALGQTHRRDPPRLRANDAAAPAGAGFDVRVEQELRHLRGLAAPSLADKDDDRIGSDCLDQRRGLLVDWELLPLLPEGSPGPGPFGSRQEHHTCVRNITQAKDTWDRGLARPRTNGFAPFCTCMHATHAGLPA